MRQHGLRCAKRAHQGLQIQKPEDQHQKPSCKLCKQTARCAAICLQILLLSEAEADEAACAHCHAEAICLNDRLQRKHHADGGRSARGNLRDKVGVGSVVDDGNQLACHGRRGKRQNQLRNRCLQHPAVLFFTGKDSWNMMLVQKNHSSVLAAHSPAFDKMGAAKPEAKPFDCLRYVIRRSDGAAPSAGHAQSAR